MLLSIDKVLQLLAEGKDIEKIAALSDAKPADVVSVLDDARSLLLKYEKEKTKKKIVIRKKIAAKDSDGRIYSEEADESAKPPFLEGVELTAMPMEDSLTVYIAAVEDDGFCGMSLVLTDSGDHQLGKTQWCLRRLSSKRGLLRAASRSLEIADYFNSRSLRIRTNDDTFVKQISAEISVSDADMKKAYDSFNEYLKKKTISLKFETVNSQQNEKAIYMAQRALPER